MINYKVNLSNFPPKWVKQDSPVSIMISSIVNHSESEKKVEEAIKNIFPTISLNKSDKNLLVGITNDEKVIFSFCNLIYDQKILDVARKCVIDGIQKSELENKGTTTIIQINKQIAFRNKINFCTMNESPLGPISIMITCQDLDLFIDTYFPKFEWFNSKPE